MHKSLIESFLSLRPANSLDRPPLSARDNFSSMSEGVKEDVFVGVRG
jgi:hypothetical protein